MDTGLEPNACVRMNVQQGYRCRRIYSLAFLKNNYFHAGNIFKIEHEIISRKNRSHYWSF